MDIGYRSGLTQPGLTGAHHFLRDEEGLLADYTASEFQPRVTLPPDAVDTGWQRADTSCGPVRGSPVACSWPATCGSMSAIPSDHAPGVNVAWDGSGHAFILDTIVTTAHRRHGVATALVAAAIAGARDAGCEWLHVDFEDHLIPVPLRRLWLHADQRWADSTLMRST